MKYMSNLLNKDNKEQNLEILKVFYNKVWMSDKRYVDNDRALYFIFKQSNKGIFSDNVKGFILNEMYSAFVKNKDLFAVIDSVIKKQESKVELFHPETEEITASDNNYPSFRSKFDHWNNEINTNTSTPINDSHVRGKLEEYGYQRILYNQYDSLKNTIDTFIKDYLGTTIEGINRIDLKTDFHDTISIYRLVDKFLWLSYRIKQKKYEGGSDVMSEYAKLTTK